VAAIEEQLSGACTLEVAAFDEFSRLVGDPDATAGFDHEACLMFGTVVEDADDLSSERVMAAAGHGAAVYYHFWFENGRSMADLPKGEDWLAAYADIPADVRHLAVHDRHLIGVNDRDRAFVTPEILQAMGATFRPDELRQRLGAMAESGMTEIAYQPAGPDIPRELEAFANAVRG